MSTPTIDNAIVAELLETKRYQEAAKAAERYLRDHPDDATMTHAYGTALYRMGEYAKALVAYQRRLDLEPDRAVAHYSLGLARRRTGDGDAAKGSFERALALDPEMTKAARQLETLSRSAQRRSPVDGRSPADPPQPTSRRTPPRRPPRSESHERAMRGELGSGTVLLDGHRNVRSRPGHFVVAFGLLLLGTRIGPLGEAIQAWAAGLENVDQDTLETAVAEVHPKLGRGLVVASLLVAARAVLASAFTRYLITTGSLTIRRGILWRKMDYYYLYEINSVEFTQGPIEAILNNATLHLKTEHIEERAFGQNRRNVRTVLKLKGIGTSSEARSLFSEIRTYSMKQEVGMRGNMLH